MKKNKLIIFDLDGTLYQFQGGSFVDSGLQKIVLENALQYIQQRLDKTSEEAKEILKSIQLKYGEDISIAMEEIYGCTRKDYFDFVWNVEAKGIIKNNQNVKFILERLNKRYHLILISDAANVWICNALEELQIKEIFGNRIFSGDGKKRKSNYNRFNEVAQRYGFAPENIISIGDQEKTDIIPSKKCGFRTIFVNDDVSDYADITIADISKVEQAINDIS